MECQGWGGWEELQGKPHTVGNGNLLNKRYNEQSNGCACFVIILVHFIVILRKIL